MARCKRVAFVALVVFTAQSIAQNPTLGQSPGSTSNDTNQPARVSAIPADPQGQIGGSASDAAVPPNASLPAEAGIWEDWTDRAANDRLWFRSDYLRFKVRNQKLPGVAGELSVSNVDPVRRLNDDLINPVVGGPAASIDYGMQSGFRLAAGLWLERGGALGIECGYFQLAPGHQRIDLRSDSSAALGPIFFDPSAGQEIIIMNSVPGLRPAQWTSAASDRLWGAEIQARWRTGIGVDVLAGYRSVRLTH